MDSLTKACLLWYRHIQWMTEYTQKLLNDWRNYSGCAFSSQRILMNNVIWHSYFKQITRNGVTGLSVHSTTFSFVPICDRKTQQLSSFTLTLTLMLLPGCDGQHLWISRRGKIELCVHLEIFAASGLKSKGIEDTLFTLILKMQKFLVLGWTESRAKQIASRYSE